MIDKNLNMDKTSSYDSKLSQARGLASQLGMFADCLLYTSDAADE